MFSRIFTGLKAEGLQVQRQGGLLPQGLGHDVLQLGSVGVLVHRGTRFHRDLRIFSELSVAVEDHGAAHRHVFGPEQQQQKIQTKPLR